MAGAAAAGQLRTGHRDAADRWGFRKEGRDLLRAVAGGAIVGLPLLYTMEMWWSGITLSSWHLLAALAGIVGVNFLFSLLSGFRESYSFTDALSEAVTSVGIGIVFSTLVLALIGSLNFDMAPIEWIGKILLEAVAVSVGVSFANAQVLGKSRSGEASGGGAQGSGAQGGASQAETQGSPEQRQLRQDLRDVGATLAGATVFAMNVAPTEEIVMIAVRLEPWQQLVMLASLPVLAYIILFASGFEQQKTHVPGPLQHPWAETAMIVAMSLGVSFALLVLFGFPGSLSHASTAVATTITLGLPATIGGAAGRLIV